MVASWTTGMMEDVARQIAATRLAVAGRLMETIGFSTANVGEAKIRKHLISQKGLNNHWL